jgi:hypothetical protein
MSKKEGEWQNISSKYVIAGLSALIILLAILVFFHIPRRNSTDDKNGKGKDNNKDDKDDNDDKKSPKLKSSKSKSKK